MQLKECLKDALPKDDVLEVIEKGEVIKEYPNDRPYPSKLMLGYINKQPLHVVVAYDTEENKKIIITTYIPEQKLWDKGYKRRKNNEVHYL